MVKPKRIHELKKLRPAFGLLALLAVWLSPCAAGAQATADTEQQMKAGFIYNFALFTDWPAPSFKDGGSPLVICIAGEQEILKSFEQLKTKKIKDRAVTVCAYGDKATGAPCHIFYISTTNPSEAATLVARLSGPGVLTIGNADGFSRLGGIITFYRADNKLRFEINTDAAQRAGLKLSSQLLNLAKIVTDRDSRK